jgi:CrcB protein
MRELLAVGVGGFIGAVLRYVAGSCVQRLWGQSGFPLGTLTVNIVGCLVIGLLAGLSDSRALFNPQIKLLLFVGILGSFTTFSTFSYEALALVREGQLIAAGASVILHLVVGLIAVWGGYTLTTLS